MVNQKREIIYYVKGMHCASCELNVERKILELENVGAVEASLGKGEVLIEFEEKAPSINDLNDLFEKEGYAFFQKSVLKRPRLAASDFLLILIVLAAIFCGYSILNFFGISSLVNVNTKSSLVTFFAFGLLAGVSSCAALVGGVVLSMSKQWAGLYSTSDRFVKKIEPHLLFNGGRIVAYAVFGGILGFLGSRLQISPVLSSILILAVSLVMIIFALDMLGIGIFSKFQITMPKVVTRYISDEKHFKGKYMPLAMGAGTFFLPCGFTITAQSMALLSASYLQGALIMGIFALGTMPSLLIIGISSAKFLDNPRWSERFLKIAGVLVLFFAVFNINSQCNAFGWPSLNDVGFGKALSVFKASQNSGIAAGDKQVLTQGEKQVIKMKASVSGYEPDRITVKAGIPVRWEIEDVGTGGCTNAIIARDLFDGRIDLTPGETAVKEFVAPKKPGVYKFSCWMGMVSGIIEVIE